MVTFSDFSQSERLLLIKLLNESVGIYAISGTNRVKMGQIPRFTVKFLSRGLVNRIFPYSSFSYMTLRGSLLSEISKRH